MLCGRVGWLADSVVSQYHRMFSNDNCKKERKNEENQLEVWTHKMSGVSLDVLSATSHPKLIHLFFIDGSLIPLPQFRT